jgi:predicted PurR-regulated permease PerM
MDAPTRPNEIRPRLGETDRQSAPSDDATSLNIGGLLDLDWQKGLVIMLTMLVGLILIWVTWQVIRPIQQTLVLFGLGAVTAFALSRPVDVLTRHVADRRLAALIVYVLVGAFVLGGATLLASPFVREATALAAAMPQYANDLQSRVPEMQIALGTYGIQTDVDEAKARAASTVEQAATDMLKNLVGMLAGMTAIVGDVLLVLVISLYLVVDGPRFLEGGRSLIPRRHRAKAMFFQDNLARVLGAYLRGQLTLALIVGLAAGIGTAVLGVPYAVVLGVLAGLFELVPMFGPVLSAVPALLVAAFMPFPTVLWVLLFFVVIQQIANNVLAPRISGDAVGLHPLGAMFALLAGFQLAGLLGGLFAVPLAGLLRVLIGAAYRDAAANPPRSGRSVLKVPAFRLPGQRAKPLTPTELARVSADGPGSTPHAAWFPHRGRGAD